MAQKHLMAALLVALAMPAACEKRAEEGPKGSRISVDGRVIEAPGDARVVLEMQDKGSGSGPNSTYKETRAAKGVGLSTSSKDAEQSFKPRDVSAGFGKDETGGGGADYSGTLTGAGGFNIFHLLGAALLLGAGLYFYLTKNTKVALSIAAGGLAMIAVGVTIETYPMLWIAGLVIVVALVAIWSVVEFNKNKANKALQDSDSEYEFFGRVVTKAVSLMPDEASKKAFKDAMEAAAGMENGRAREIVAYFRNKIGS